MSRMSKPMHSDNERRDHDKFYHRIGLLTFVFLMSSMIAACDYKTRHYFSPSTSSLPIEQIELDVPMLISPSDGATDLDVNQTFEWSLVDQATAYDFQIIKEGESFENANGFSQYGLTENQYFIEGLELQTSYRWRVRASADDVFSDWSADRGFRTMDIPPTLYPLAVSVVGEGRVTSEPQGVDCGEDCAEEYEEGTEVILTADAADDWIFDGWAGDIPEECANGSSSCRVTMDRTRNIEAIFIQNALSIFFDEVLVCVEHGVGQSEIYWLMDILEFGGADLFAVMLITNPDGTQDEIEIDSYEDLQALFEYTIFSYGKYGWKIIYVEVDGQEVEFTGTTEGTVDVDADEQNPGECN